MNKQYWGYHSQIDLKGCDHALIRRAVSIEDFTILLVEHLGMKAYGNPQIVMFGDTPEVKGYSLVQLIYTSSIVGHFVELDNSAYIDIFSCKYYNREKAAQFCADFFKAKSYKLTSTDRM